MTQRPFNTFVLETGQSKYFLHNKSGLADLGEYLKGNLHEKADFFVYREQEKEYSRNYWQGYEIKGIEKIVNTLKIKIEKGIETYIMPVNVKERRLVGINLHRNI